MMWTLRLVILCTLLWTVPAQAATYYVDGPGGNGPGGNDANGGGGCVNGDPNAAEATINSGISCLTAGDTLFIRGGTYNNQPIGQNSALGFVPSGTDWFPNAVTIAGFPGETVILGQHNGPIVLTASESYIIFDNLIVDGTGTGMGSAFHVGCETHHVRLQNSEVRNTSQDGNALSLITGCGSFMEFVNNKIHHARHYGSYWGGHHTLFDGNEWWATDGFALHLYSSGQNNVSDNIIRNNLFRDGGYGPPFPEANIEGGVIISSGPRNQFYNNIITNMFGGLQVDSRCHNCEVYNNTIHETGLVSRGGGGNYAILVGPNDVTNNVIIQNNILWGNQVDDIQMVFGFGQILTPNFTADPHFVNPGAYNFRLQPSSPAKDAGIIIPLVTTDIANPYTVPPSPGIARPQGAGNSMGAYEFQEGGGAEPNGNPIYLSAGGHGDSPSDGAGDVQSCINAESIATPKATLAGACACMQTVPGKELRIRGGVYAATLDTLSCPIRGGSSWATATRLTAYQSETVTLQLPVGQQVLAFLHNAATDAYIIFNKLIFDAMNRPNSTTFAVVGGHHIRVIDSIIRNATFENVYLEGVSDIEFTSSTPTPTMQVLNSTGYGFHGFGSISNLLIEQTRVHGHGNRAIHLNLESGSHSNTRILRSIISQNGVASAVEAIGIGPGPGAQLVNNQIYRNFAGVRIYTGASGATLSNNTLANNTNVGFQCDAGASTVRLRNTILWLNGTNIPVNNCGMVPGTGLVTNMTTDPLFTNQGADVYTLADASTAINTGTNLPEVLTDFAGAPRPGQPGSTGGMTYDIGAFERDGGPGPDPGALLGVLSALLRVDGFGYLPTAQKIALLVDPVTGFNAAASYTPGGTIQVLESGTNALLFSGAPVAWSAGATHAQSGDRVWRFDFSSVVAPGTYYLYDPTNGLRSEVFRVATNVYTDVLKTAMRTYFYQRSGFAKAAPFTDARWVDGAAFLGANQDPTARSALDQGNAATARDLRGGWFDAGDYNKYTVPAAFTLTELLLAYQEFPGVFGDNTGIPESGNGLPDLLDEVKWELDWLVRMQTATGGNGSVLMKVSSLAPVATSPPSADTVARFYAPPSTMSSAMAAGALAHAATVFASAGQTAYATTLTTAAEAAWTWALANPNVPSNNSGFTTVDPEADLYGTNIAYFRAMSLVYAAAFLYGRTGHPAYRTYFDTNYVNAQPIMWTYWYPFESWVQAMLLYYTKQGGATPAVVAAIRTSKTSAMAHADSVGALTGDLDAYRAYLKDTDFTFGSNSTKMHMGNIFLDMLRYNLDPANHTAYRNAGSGYLHHVHGTNAMGQAYLSNMGPYGAERSVNEFYHAWFDDGTIYDHALTSPNGPAPGFLVGGPNPNYSGNQTPPLGQPIQKFYKDFNTHFPGNSWEITENGIYYQAPYIRLLAAFAEAAPLIPPTFTPLVIDNGNPRYFSTPTGTLTYLAGAYDWNFLSDNMSQAEAEAYVNFWSTTNQNLIRAPSWDPVHFTPATNPPFDTGYWAFAASRIALARSKGLYVSIPLLHFLDQLPFTDLTFCETYVRNVMGVIGVYDNVLVEVGNELDTFAHDSGTVGFFVDHIVDVIKAHQASLGRLPLPVGISEYNGDGTPGIGLQPAVIAAMLSSSADFVTMGWSEVATLQDTVLPIDRQGAKVVFVDTDHIWPYNINHVWVWKAFMRGHNVLVLDGNEFYPTFSEDDDGNSSPLTFDARMRMGDTRAYAARVDMRLTTPQPGLSTTGWALANPGTQYLVYQPGSGAFNVTLVAGTYSVEWFNASTKAVTTAANVTGSGSTAFTPPHADAVLLLTVVPPPEVPQSVAKMPPYVSSWFQ